MIAVAGQELAFSYLRDGKPTVVVHLCSSKDRLTGLSLREDGPEPLATALLALLPPASRRPQPA